MKIEHNLNNSYCTCDFEWVVIDENGRSIFGAYTVEECETYIADHLE